VKKFDTLISNYLYTNKKLDIEGIGTFTLDDNFVLPPDAEKTAFFPLEGIHFVYSTRAQTSPGLLDYLVQQTGKIRSLISADFSSYVSEIKQFVNIGKPWVIEGLGTLQKIQDGSYELIPGEATSERVNMHYVDESEKDGEPVKRNRWIVGLLFSIAIIAVIAGLGFGIYMLFIKTTDSAPVTPVVVTAPVVDTTNHAASDSIIKKPDSLTVTQPSDFTNGNNYKAIFEITKWKERVNKRTTQLAQYGIRSFYDSMVIRDTLRYRMFVYQKILPADSIKVRDSLSLFFGRRVRLERTQ
jgi:hypothetical protein